MGDSKDKPKKQKEKKPTPFRNGLIIGFIIGAFLGLLIDTPGFMSPIKDPIAGMFKSAEQEARTKVGETMEEGGKAITDKIPVAVHRMSWQTGISKNLVACIGKVLKCIEKSTVQVKNY